MISSTGPVHAPLTDTIIVAIAQLVDDAQSSRRDPSHSDLGFLIQRLGLADGDPKAQGQNVGKTKRVRSVLSWAIEHRSEAGAELVRGLLDLVRGHGGFRESSPNFVGRGAIENAIAAFATEGYVLEPDGQMRPQLLDGLAGVAFTEAVNRYIQRARQGIGDVALVTGTGKDLLEAIAATILEERFGSYPTSSNFPTLLGQAFVALGLATPQDPVIQGEPANRRVERAMFELACALNQLRNKQGTGHGRPWLPTVSDAEAKMAVESMGIISERLWTLHRATI